MRILFKAVAVGGTFDLLHKGHESLFKKAFQMGKLVVIGVTSDEFALRLNKNPNHPYKVRVEMIEEYLNKAFPNRRYELHSLNDYFGPRVYDKDVEAIVVSEETLVRVSLANKIRVSNGLKPLKTLILRTVLADDGLPISTTRIKQGRIDKEGHILKS